LRKRKNNYKIEKINFRLNQKSFMFQIQTFEKFKNNAFRKFLIMARFLEKQNRIRFVSHPMLAYTVKIGHCSLFVLSIIRSLCYICDDMILGFSKNLATNMLSNIRSIKDWNLLPNWMEKRKIVFWFLENQNIIEKARKDFRFWQDKIFFRILNSSCVCILMLQQKRNNIE